MNYIVKKMPPKVLVVISDSTFSTTICNIIERYWYNTIRAMRYDDAVNLVVTHKPNIVIINDSFDRDLILALIKNANSVSTVIIPFLILCSRVKEYSFDSELVASVRKPFTPYEIMSAIKSLLRKSNPVFQTQILQHKDLTMNLSTYKVFKDDREIHLGPTEFKILQIFMNEPETIYSRTDIIEGVWGKGYQIEKRTIDVHINRIRVLLKNPSNNSSFIKTIRGRGYCLSVPGES